MKMIGILVTGSRNGSDRKCHIVFRV